MIQLFSEGAYLVDGTTLVKESEAEALKQLTGEVVSKEEASKNTIAYGILRDTIHLVTWRNFRLNSIN